MKFAVLYFLALVNAQDKLTSKYVPQMIYLLDDGEVGRDKWDEEVMAVIMGCYGKHGQHEVTPQEGTAPSATVVKGFDINDVISFNQECTLFNCYMDDGGLPETDIWSKFTYPFEDCTEMIRWHNTLKANPLNNLKCTPVEYCSNTIPTIRSTGMTPWVDVIKNDTEAIEHTCMKEVLTASLPPKYEDRFEMGCEMNNCYYKEAKKVNLWSKMLFPTAECTKYQTEHKKLKTENPDLKCIPVECSGAHVFMKPVASIFVLILYLF